MPTLDLGRLEREGRVRIQTEIPPDSPILAGTGLRIEDPLEVDLTATRTIADDLLVRGEVRGTVVQECRRCLRRVDTPLEVTLALIYSHRDELAPEEETGEVRRLDPRAGRLELGEALREELVLSAPEFVVCRADCKGICPRCGADLNETRCECRRDEGDPRWDVLRALTKDPR